MGAIRVLSAGAVKRGVTRMAQTYAGRCGIEVAVEFATAPQLRTRFAAGEEADVAVAPPSVLDALETRGRLVAGSRAFIGRSRMGVVIHAGAPRSAVADVDAFKALLSAAPLVVHNTASSGIYAAKLLDELGLTAALGPRIVTVDTGAGVMERVAGHPPGAVGLAQISEIRVMIDKGLPVRLAAPLPDAIQNVTRYDAAAIAGRPEAATAADFARCLASDEAKAVFSETGID